MSAGLDHVTLCGIGKNPYHYHLVTIALVGNCHNGVTVFLIAEFDFFNKSCNGCHRGKHRPFCDSMLPSFIQNAAHLPMRRYHALMKKNPAVKPGSSF